LPIWISRGRRRLRRRTLPARPGAIIRCSAFTGQALSPANLQAFACRFGPFGDDPHGVPMADYPHLIEVRREAHETPPIFGSAWHSGTRFQPTPPSATLLYGAQIQPQGGNPVFADGYAACAALSPTMHTLLAGLDGVHSAAPAYGPKGLFSRDDASRSMQIVVSADAARSEVHPLVRRYPVSGRAARYVNHVGTGSIDGMRLDESRALPDFLCRHLTREEFVHRHH